MTERRERRIDNPLRWLPEYLAFSHARIRKQGRLLAASLLVGLIAGLAAILFFAATQFATRLTLEGIAGYYAVPAPRGEPEPNWLPHFETPFRPWLLLIVPAVGGLLSGLLVFTLAPEAEGHGTDSVIDAYHRRRGQIRPRVPLVKIVASAITIGTGGSGGREGPIAQIGAGFGSALATFTGMGPADRRVLLAAGMGAGVAAIFRAPLAGALFASEVLYWSPEFEPEVIIPAGVASVVSYCTFGVAYGWNPLFATPALSFASPWELLPYFALAMAMVVLAMLYTRTFYAVTRLFQGVPLPRHVKPAIGAGLAGLLGVGLYYLIGDQRILAVLSFGYNGIQYAIDGDGGVSAWILMGIALGKIVTTSLTIASGGSGGVFGPSMVIGGCAGGAVGLAIRGIWPTLVPHPATYVIVGMAGFFAAAAKTPFSTLVIVSEMTGGYHLLLPSLWVCVLSFMLSDEYSIYGSQVEGRSHSPAHQGYYVRQVLAGVPVRQFLNRDERPPCIPVKESLAGVLERFHDASYTALPVVDPSQIVLGMINLEEVHLASHTPDLAPLVVAEDLMRADIEPLCPDDTLDRAMELFARNDLLILPVVASRKHRELLGLVTRFQIASAYLQRVHGPREPATVSAGPIW